MLKPINVFATISDVPFTTKIDYDSGSFLADESIELGGQGKGPSPSQLLASSLASCTAITLKMYCNRKEWKFDSINVKVSLEKSNAGIIFNRTIYFNGHYDDIIAQRLLYIADRCPIHKILTETITIKTEIK